MIWSTFGKRWAALPSVSAALSALGVSSFIQTLLDDADAATARVTLGAVGSADIREKLTANRTYYVRTDGSNSNNGLANTSGGAFLTLQKAADVIFGTLDLGGFTVTVQVGDGTYTAGVNQASPQVGAGSVLFQGNTSTPGNCIISVTGSSCFVGTNAAVQFTVNGFELRTTTSGNCVEANNGASLTIGSNMRFGACATRHVQTTRTGVISISTGYTITGNASAHFYAEQAGVIFSNGDAFVTEGAPAITTFCQAATGGNVRVTGATFSGTGATGTRYSVTGNAVVNTNGGGASYFPGSVAGATATGGQYL